MTDTSTSPSTSATHTLELTVGDSGGPVELTVTDRGRGRPFLLLHGGAGPQSVEGFAELMAGTQPIRVITPIHPGFAGSPRPESLTSPAGLAALYDEMLDQLDLNGVTVIGNSMGGWIAAEMAVLGSERISGIVLVDAVGIEVDGHPVADFFSLTMDQVVELSYHNPDAFRIDVSQMPVAQQQAMAGNRATLSVYAGTSMADPTLRARLGSTHVPTLVLAGESDRIVDAEYARAFAEAIPGAHFELLSGAGHVPQIETPDQLLASIGAFVGMVEQ
jgi:pimeloyl-ACP methyl ester carboxylesterase